MDPTLLAALMGGTATPQAPAPSPTDAPSAVQPQVTPQAASLTQALSNPGQPGQIGQPQPQGNQTPIMVQAQGDTWHPHKRSLLGTIADFALAALGVPLFPFGHANKAQNIQDAMAGFQANPRQAIHRLAQIKGEEFEAANLAGQEDDSDMKSANYKRLNDNLDFQKQKNAEGIAANMMYSASQNKDPASAWQAMREQVARRDAVNGTNVADEIPESPDLSAIDILAGANIPAWRQAALLEEATHHRATEQTADANSAESARHHRADEGLGGARVGISQQNADTSARNASTAEQRLAAMQGRYQQTHQAHTVRAPDGTPGRTSNDGTMMVLYRNDGKKLLYLRGKDGHHWHFSHQVQDLPAGFENGNDTPPE